MKSIILAAATVIAATSAFAEGDVDKGKKAFGKCKACHSVVTPEGDVLFKGGRTGPNLFGVIGRPVGTADFRYSKALVEMGDNGIVWDEASLAAFASDPRGYLKEQGIKGKTKMTFKLKKGSEDVAAFLASLNPAPAEEMPTDEAPTEETPAEATDTTASETGETTQTN